jgi:Spy/CpxP family protein refolding chaperone
MTRRVLSTTLLLVLFALTASAMDLPPGKWWRRPEIVQQLTLTDDQQSRLDAIFRTAANDLIDRKGEVEKQSIALRGELDQPKLDREAIRRIGAKLNEARGKLFERELMMLVDMRAVLTDEQWNRMRSALDQMGRHPDGQGGGGGRGGRFPNRVRP